jgi:hypothetical protein|tara:strand:- start:361 stop:558 length:198 start_codon:yes stop_codon:yes gene_type:complete
MSKYETMIKYRVINKEILACDMDLEEALMTVEVLRINNPDKIYDIEDYNWTSVEQRRLGRDPDLH